MPPTDIPTLQRALDKGRRGGVFFLWGDEEYLQEEVAATLVEAHLDPATRDFNLDELRGGELAPETLASVLATPPMMAEWRVVVVRDVQALAGAPNTRAAVEEAAAATPPGLALILLARIPDKSKAKFYTTLKKQAVSLECAPLAPGDVPGWLVARAEGAGVKLESAAARALAGALGGQLGPLVKELEKLVDYIGERGVITAEDVAAVVENVPSENRWDWFDRVGGRSFAEARARLPVLLEADTGVGLVIGLGTHFLRLGLAVAGGQRALDAALPPYQRWVGRRLAQQARAWDMAGIDAALDDLLRADRLLKSASLTDRQVLEEFLLRREVGAEAAA
ncbi:MAG: DNA polymerase III subunit delta [Gemmatimonadota bacterium]